MNFTLTVLGTASAMPVTDKNQSAHVLEVRGRLFLIDCGEGTQQRLRSAGLSFIKIDSIFISHIHGDHVFGLFGLISTMGMYGRTAPLDIYGPRALGSILNFFDSFFAYDLGFEVRFHMIDCKDIVTILENSYVKVSAFPLQHGIECYGYRFDGVRTTKTPADSHIPSFAYCSDTAPFPQEAEYVKGVDLLYHESTYTADNKEKAVKYLHSTSEDAAKVALQAGVGTLVLGHYSARCRDNAVYQGEAAAIFAQTIAAADGDVFKIPYLR